MNILETILKINPNAKVTVRGNDINTCEIEWHNGTTPISKADIEAMIPTVETEIANAEADAIAKKASGKQKLLDLGLSEEEVKALTGA
jgi:hypothetical protein